jgi:hypothetical protein
MFKVIFKGLLTQDQGISESDQSMFGEACIIAGWLLNSKGVWYGDNFGEGYYVALPSRLKQLTSEEEELFAAE